MPAMTEKYLAFDVQERSADSWRVLHFRGLDSVASPSRHVDALLPPRRCQYPVEFPEAKNMKTFVDNVDDTVRTWYRLTASLLCYTGHLVIVGAVLLKANVGFTCHKTSSIKPRGPSRRSSEYVSFRCLSSSSLSALKVPDRGCSNKLLAKWMAL